MKNFIQNCFPYAFNDSSRALNLHRKISKLLLIDDPWQKRKTKQWHSKHSLLCLYFSTISAPINRSRNEGKRARCTTQTARPYTACGNGMRASMQEMAALSPPPSKIVLFVDFFLFCFTLVPPLECAPALRPWGVYAFVVRGGNKPWWIIVHAAYDYIQNLRDILYHVKSFPSVTLFRN